MQRHQVIGLALLAIAVALFYHAQTSTRQVNGQVSELAASRQRAYEYSFDLNRLESPEPDRRREVYAELRGERAAMIRRLENMVKSEGQRESGSTKALAAQLLGDWRALEAVPTLAMEMKYHAPGFRVIASLFDFDQYPCAQAIRDMGLSALKPFVEWIAQRKAPLEEEDVRIASHIIYAILEYDKVETLNYLGQVETRYPESPRFRTMRRYIEERIPDREARK